MWVVTCQDYVIGRSCDHDITFYLSLTYIIYNIIMYIEILIRYLSCYKKQDYIW